MGIARQPAAGNMASPILRPRPRLEDSPFVRAANISIVLVFTADDFNPGNGPHRQFGTGCRHPRRNDPFKPKRTPCSKRPTGQKRTTRCFAHQKLLGLIPEKLSAPKFSVFPKRALRPLHPLRPLREVLPPFPNLRVNARFPPRISDITHIVLTPVCG